MTRQRQRVVVGYDGSPAARSALLWAAAEAASADEPLVVVVAWQPDVGSWAFSAGRRAEADAERMTHQAVAMAHGATAGRVPVTSVVRKGDPSRVLLHEVNDVPGTRLAVLGTRGHVGALGALLGSVARGVMKASRRPVVLLGPETRVAPTNRVVTTCPDGYAEGAAIEWAVDYAVARDVELLLLDTWRTRAMGPELSWPETVSAARLEAEERHAQALDELRRRVAGEVPVSGRLVGGQADDVEYAVTGRGDLLVVGRDDREHRPSLRYEQCPVVVVPEQALVEDVAPQPVTMALAEEGA